MKTTEIEQVIREALKRVNVADEDLILKDKDCGWIDIDMDEDHTNKDIQFATVSVFQTGMINIHISYFPHDTDERLSIAQVYDKLSAKRLILMAKKKEAETGVDAYKYLKQVADAYKSFKQAAEWLGVSMDDMKYINIMKEEERL